MPGLVRSIDTLRRSRLKICMTFIEENKDGKRCLGSNTFLSKNWWRNNMSHSECCWDIAITYLWQSARSCLSVSFVFSCCIKKIKWTMALLVFPHCFQGTPPFHNSHLMPGQFLETCAHWSGRDKEACRALCLFTNPIRCNNHITGLWEANNDPAAQHPSSTPWLHQPWSFPSLAYTQHKLLLLSILGSREGWVRFYYLKPRPRKFLRCVDYEEVVLLSLSCSMHKVPFWIIFTGQSGTTTNP